MSNKEKRSRLEKLLCILEGAHAGGDCCFNLTPMRSRTRKQLSDFLCADSKNDQTLRLAAQKIADVALQQPHHIPSVLRQVRSAACGACVCTTARLLTILMIYRCTRSCTARSGKPVFTLGMFWVTWHSEWNTAQSSASVRSLPKLSMTPGIPTPSPTSL